MVNSFINKVCVLFPQKTIVYSINISLIANLIRKIEATKMLEMLSMTACNVVNLVWWQLVFKRNFKMKSSLLAFPYR